MLTVSSQFYDSTVQDRYKNPKYFSIEEVALHNSELDAWSVIEGKVYNITPFISMHPGGDKIVKAYGTDITEVWSKRSSLSNLRYRGCAPGNKPGGYGGGAAF